MKRMKELFLLVLLGFSLFFLTVCTSKYKEPAPFFDGLFLEYSLLSQKPIYEVHALKDQKYKIVETIKYSALGDEINEFYVDSYGKVYKSNIRGSEGTFSPIWIPGNKMKIGDTFDNDCSVLRKDKWKRWEVLVIKNPLVDEEQYYDVNTGYRVGSFARTTGGSAELVLIRTNANIPVAEKNSVEEGRKPDGETK